MLFFALARLLFLILFNEQLPTLNVNLLLVFPLGLRTDISILFAAILLPCLMLLLLPQWTTFYLRYIFSGILTFIFVILCFLEIVSGAFLYEYGVRPNQLLIQYLSHPKEVFNMIWESYTLLIVLSMSVLLGLSYGCWRICLVLFSSINDWSYVRRLVVLPLVVVVMLVGIRSGIGKIPPNPSMVMYSNNQILNQITLNAAYSLFFSIYRSVENAIESEKFYGHLPEQEIFDRVKRHMSIDMDDFVEGPSPSQHVQRSHQAAQPPKNLVIILMESLGAEFVASLGGVSVTPNLEQLAKQGLYFTALYSIGTRTSRGIEALVSGFLPTTQYGSILKLPESQYNFFTIGALLKQHQYHTTFIYGGEAHFDNMSGFVLGNGFDQVIDLNDLPDKADKSIWGVVDEDLFIYANEQFRQMSPPFLSLVLTISNHKPYDIPDGKITLHEQPKASVNNAAKYADFALGRFFERAAQENYYQNTIFLLVADHSARVMGKELVPINQFHIPAVIIGPNIPQQRYTKLASQIDLLPTVLPFLGIDVVHPMVGRNVLLLPDAVPGRAFMQYGNNNAYQVGRDVVIHQPHKPAVQFKIENNQLVTTVLDPVLRKDALAHILFPSIVYNKHLYHLP